MQPSEEQLSCRFLGAVLRSMPEPSVEVFRLVRWIICLAILAMLPERVHAESSPRVIPTLESLPHTPLDTIHQHLKARAGIALAKLKAELDARMKILDTHLKAATLEQKNASRASSA